MTGRTPQKIKLGASELTTGFRMTVGVAIPDMKGMRTSGPGYLQNPHFLYAQWKLVLAGAGISDLKLQVVASYLVNWFRMIMEGAKMKGIGTSWTGLSAKKTQTWTDTHKYTNIHTHFTMTGITHHNIN